MTIRSLSHGLLAGALLYGALPAFALQTQIIECRYAAGGFGLPFPRSMQGDYRITRRWVSQLPAQVDGQDGVWNSGDYRVIGSSEVTLYMIEEDPIVLQGSEPALRMVDRHDGGNDVMLDSSVYTGTVEIEEHTFEQFGFKLDEADGSLFENHLQVPDLEPAAVGGPLTRSTCSVRMRDEGGRPVDLPAIIISYTVIPDDGSQSDQDGDVVFDVDDNCQSHYNPGQEDADHDGLGDACDLEFSRDINHANVPAGDSEAFMAALVAANQRGPNSITQLNLRGNLVLGPPDHDGPEIVLIHRDIRIVGARANGQRSVIENTGEADGLRFITVVGDGALTLENVEIAGFNRFRDGGAVGVLDAGSLKVLGSVFRGNTSGLDGGAVHFSSTGELDIEGALFEGNVANRGGALYLDALPVLGETIRVGFTRFEGNFAALTGCDIDASVPGSVSARLHTLTINQDCAPAGVLNQGTLRTASSTLTSSGDLLNSGGGWELLSSVMALESPVSLQAIGDSPRTDRACQKLGGGQFSSLGYNLSYDDSCALQQAGDQQSTDPLLDTPDGDGIRIPLPGSPVIDAGPHGLLSLGTDDWPVLPCSWKDARGLGRPQDADGDGKFQCDIGAVEVQGAGAIEAGHSGAFFNPQRNGEGQYVEILDDDRALIYTFTYRPGGGPAWFLAVADVVGNSLVSNAMIRPVGTSFGDEFDAEAIWFADWGGMSMVFHDCNAANRPGNAVYSGSRAFGYEPLATRAARLTDIAGCDGAAASAMAGLSGSFYDPGRNGEGIVVEWLPDGRVLAIMFTYDLEDQQFWTFGVGTPNGSMVTMEAIYPAGSAAWGGSFDPDAVGLESFGSFTLDYADCDNMTFSYASSLAGYGSASRDYTRLSSLKGLDCPAF